VYFIGEINTVCLIAVYTNSYDLMRTKLIHIYIQVLVWVFFYRVPIIISRVPQPPHPEKVRTAMPIQYADIYVEKLYLPPPPSVRHIFQFERKILT